MKKKRSRLLTALFAGPAIGAIDFLTLYILIGHVRSTHDKTLMHLVSAIALALLIVATAYPAIIMKRETPRKKEEREERNDDRFLARLGFALNAFLLLLVLAFEVPIAMFAATD